MTQGGLRICVLIVVALFGAGPILAGLWQALRASFAVLPAIGATAPSLAPWRELAHLPGIATSLRLTLISGLGATALALLLVMAVCITRSGRDIAAHAPKRPRHARMGTRQDPKAQPATPQPSHPSAPSAGPRTAHLALAPVLAPFLAAPHAAMAIGLAFVIAPSGWIARAIALILGWSSPPAWITVHDPGGVALMLGLVIKEFPFLMLVTLSALNQIPLHRTLVTGRTLGYGTGTLWLKTVLPQIWPMLRVPVMIVLAYALSNVDMALILGPSNPPTLAVLLTRLFSDPDTTLLLPASAGAVVQALLVLATFGVLWATGRAMRAVGLVWLRLGGRGARPAWPGQMLRTATSVVMAGLLTLGTLSVLALLMWSLAWRWPFPGLLPQTWSLHAWQGAQGNWHAPLITTLVLALATTALSTLLAIAWLEGEDRARKRTPAWGEAMIYLPLLVPQISFLYGLNILFLRLGLSGGLAAVIWAQTLFVFPYVMIALAAPWRALDPRLARTAAALGAGPWRQLVAVKLPTLLRPLLIAAAVGGAVSVAQYLPTLFMGAGRMTTLTTEAVTLASGSDRRITAVTAALQAALPFAGFLAALLIPAVLHRDRRALRGGGGSPG
ncbi:ABC transporter permease subunit [Pseudooceanicola sediminis]|uniref:ABC transporter permease subunit n=1 Tax=Pseudooceanicola sediminis TaxID=2211117 RepID=A0A399J362_9RHOB|nr:ABC transporter permease subunit [Pseudooceanicola sediminis]KAA2315084.1 ABC transporter permease subunit [Puniceibacterium sp. HSS470]RII38899.1 ABC transporter permease subunit [Pseudooceanicola sediminis]|tara:strand:+ start:30269 stop:32110 length:1842 start_codon:yes stop_codon:yes gene_type:complete